MRFKVFKSRKEGRLEIVHDNAIREMWQMKLSLTWLLYNLREARANIQQFALVSHQKSDLPLKWTKSL